MEAVTQILAFIASAERDNRVKPVHVSLYMALVQYWVLNNATNPFQVSRRIVMKTAKISSIVTFHKVVKELQVSGYIDYIPSYDPRTRTQVFIKEIQGAI